jgi:hypothetical protein
MSCCIMFMCDDERFIYERFYLYDCYSDDQLRLPVL